MPIDLLIVIGTLVSIVGGFAIATYRDYIGFKKKSKGYYERIRNEASFQKEKVHKRLRDSGYMQHTIAIAEGVNMTLWDKSSSWTVTFTLEDGRPFFVFDYIPTKKSVANSRYGYDTGSLKDYILLPPEQLEEIVAILQKIAIEGIEEIMADEKLHESNKQPEKMPENSPVQPLQTKNIVRSSETGIVRMKDHQDSLYKWKETKDHYHYYYMENTQPIYTIIQEKETGDIVLFDMDEVALSKVEDVHEYTKEQKANWSEVKEFIGKEAVKKEQIKEEFAVFLKEMVTRDVWKDAEFKLQEKREGFLVEKDLLTEESLWYLETKLPEHLKKVRHLNDTEQLTKAQNQEIIQTIETRFAEIENEIQKKKEKEAERVVLLSRLQ